MVKLLFLCRRRGDITHHRYVRLLLDGHVPLALRHHPTLRRYAVNIVDDTIGGVPPLDSIGALWFDTLADFHERLYDSPAGERIVARDVAGFLGGAVALVVREETVSEPPRGARLGDPTPGTKLIVGLTAAAAVPSWRDRAGLRGLRFDHVEGCLDGSPPRYVGFAEVYLGEGASLPGGVAGYRVTEYVER